MREQPPHNPPLTTDLDLDVAVIGGGYTGLSAAYHIRKAAPSKRVALFEARGVGNGASGRNGGMLLPNVANEYLHLASPPDVHKRIYDLTVESMKNLVALAAASRIEGAVEPVGALQTFETQAEAEQGRAYTESVRRLGIPVKYLDRGRTVEVIGTGAYTGSVYEPNAGHVHPIKLVHVLKLAAEATGVMIYEDSPVLKVEEGPIHRLHMAGGKTVKARSLVLATNAFTSKLGYFRNAMAPVYNYVAATRSLSDTELASIGWRSRMPFNDSRTLVYYLGLTPDNRIHIGGGSAAYAWNDGVATRPDAKAVDLLRKELARLYPAARGIEFEVAWNGMVDMTLDWSPLVGVTGKHQNIYYGLGYCGHGVNLTFLFGRIIADLEAGREKAWREFPFVNRKPLYVPNEPFRWIGIQAEIAYDGFVDE
jgi:glycine/D-amino acid oxidase-like deaminating enzyme